MTIYKTLDNHLHISPTTRYVSHLHLHTNACLFFLFFECSDIIQQFYLICYYTVVYTTQDNGRVEYNELSTL